LEQTAATTREEMASRHITPAPGSADYEDQIAEYGRDIRPQQYAAITICAAAATIAVALRLYTQRRFRKQWGLDDALILMALVSLNRILD